MRGYECHFYHLQNGVLKKNDNTACWAGIQGKKGSIYINKYKEKLTQKYVDVLVETINKITPCSVVKIGNSEYIKFDLLPTYDQSLVLLNFIRNLWHSPTNYYDYENDGDEDGDVNGSYSKAFFENLSKIRKKDPLVKLTGANIKACEATKIRGSIGHSNCHNHSKLKEKKADELKEYKGRSTYAFLSS